MSEERTITEGATSEPLDSPDTGPFPDFAKLAEASSDAYFRLSFDRGFTYISPGFERLTGREPGDLLHRPDLLLALIHPEDLQNFQAAIDALRPGDRLDPPLVLRILGPEAAATWVELFMVPILGADGRVSGVDGIARDVSQHLQVADLLGRRTREQSVLLQFQQELLAQLDLNSTLERVVEKAHALLEGSTCVLFLLEPDGKTLTPLAVTGEHEDQLFTLRLTVGEGLTGWVVRYGLPQRVDHTLEDSRMVYVPGVGDQDRSMLCVPLQIGGQIAGAIALNGRPAQYAEDDLDFLVALAQIASLAIANSQLFDRVQQLATLDGLTGAFNRNFLDDNLPAEISRARRLGDSIGLLILDVDQLKLVNDQHGHLAGDRVLKYVVARLRASLRETDWVARYGGDEFAVVLPGCPVGRLLAIGEKVLRSLTAAEVELENGSSLSVGATVGGAVFPDHAADAQSLLRAADEAERHAKRSGGARVVVRDSPSTR